jgi:hypothetical protein
MKFDAQMDRGVLETSKINWQGILDQLDQEGK